MSNDQKENLVKIQDELKLLELTDEHLLIRIKPEIVNELKSLTSNDETLHKALLTILDWVQNPIVWLDQIQDIDTEIVPTQPGKKERTRIIIKSQHRGYSRVHEVELDQASAQHLMNEIKKRIKSQF